MIMFCADVHLGHKSYHTLNSEYITTAEQDTRNALEGVYNRATKDDIDLIIFGGDYFHSSKPSPENIRWAINWFKKMDSLNKPFYIIPGNHDIGTYSHALVFLKSLNTKNIFLLENTISKIVWFDWNIYFVPFLCPLSSKNKYANTLQELNAVMSTMDPAANNIVISHLQEREAQLGSEAGYIARAADVIDLAVPTQYKNTIFLTGHIHKGQIYQKSNGIKVVYPGSLTYMDFTDCGQRKGYVVIPQSGLIDFEFVPGIRIFKKYNLPEGKTIQELLGNVRMSPNDVVFIDTKSSDVLDDQEIIEYLHSRGCTLGKIRYSTSDTDESVQINVQSINPVIVLEDYLKAKFEATPEFDWQTMILPLGKEFLINADKYNRD